jgi:hypothetical protein
MYSHLPSQLTAPSQGLLFFCFPPYQLTHMCTFTNASWVSQANSVQEEIWGLGIVTQQCLSSVHTHHPRTPSASSNSFSFKKCHVLLSNPQHLSFPLAPALGRAQGPWSSQCYESHKGIVPAGNTVDGTIMQRYPIVCAKAVLCR